MRQDHGELVAADAIGAIGPAQRPAEQLAEAAQYAVAAGMAAPVVDRLELVEVDEEQAQRDLVAQRAGNLPVELLVEGAMVAEPGEGVGQRIGHGSLVADLEVGLGGDDRGDGSSQGEGRQRDGRAARDHDRDEGIVGEDQNRPMDDGERDDRCHHAGEHAPRQAPRRDRHGRSARLAGLHTPSNCCVPGLVQCGIADPVPVCSRTLVPSPHRTTTDRTGYDGSNRCPNAPRDRSHRAVRARLPHRTRRSP